MLSTQRGWCVGLLALALAVGPAGVALARPGGPADPAGDAVPKDAVRLNPDTGHARLVFDSGGYLTAESDRSAERVVRTYLREHAELFGLNIAQAARLETNSSYQTRHNGAWHVTLQQKMAGLPVYGGLLHATVDRSGRLVSVGGFAATGTATAAAVPRLTAWQALREAASAADVKPRKNLAGAQNVRPDRQRFPNVFARGVKDAAPVTTELVWWPSRDGEQLRAAWYTDIEIDSTRWLETVVDADSGAVLHSDNRYEHDGPEGTVFNGQHPEDSGPRSITSFSGIDGSWASGTTTEGNNVTAYRDRDDSDANDEYQPTAADQHFNFPFTNDWRNDADGDAESLDADQDAVITQLFYYNNVMHDWLYQLGFDEASRNFQVNNFGRGGLGGDPVRAEAQDGWDVGSRNNANFATPPDGLRPRMQMFMWTPSFPYTDGSLDGDVIAHEYGHGVSNRLVGGGNLGGGPHTGALGEGWSDTVSFLKWGDVTVGEYVTGDSATGIRSQAYDTSTEGYGSFNAARGVHRNGEVWAATMYDIRERKGLGFTSQLVIDGMKSTVSTPDFLDARDGILAADMATNGGANQCLLWNVFAGRGMGTSATSGPGQLIVDDAHDVPAECRPGADAGGPYHTVEGTDVVLDGTGSTPASDTSGGPIVAYEWDFDGDSVYDDAAGATAVFDRVGRDDSFIIALRVTDAAGNTDTDRTTLQVANVAPEVLVDPIEPSDEGDTVTVSGLIRDPGWLDPLSASIDLDDGAGVRPLTGAEEHVRPDGTIAFTVEHVYGDNAVFDVRVCGRDDDVETCTVTPAVVGNVPPDATINGPETYLAHVGDPVTVEGRSIDPGSDDLELTWDWGDGQHNTLVSLVDPPNLDPAESPSVQPRDVTAARSHVYADACLYTVTFSSRDDDGGVGADTAAVVITGNADTSRSSGYWLNQYRNKPPNHFTAERLQCYLDIVAHMSDVFDAPLTREQAADILSTSGSHGDAAQLFDKQALAAWLNFANGAVDLDTPVDTDGDGSPDTSFGSAMTDAEAVRTGPSSTRQEILDAKDVVERIVLRDEG